jgi:hypothetical protein
MAIGDNPPDPSLDADDTPKHAIDEQQHNHLIAAVTIAWQ